MALKVKEEFAGVVIGFRNNSQPLGKRSESDLNFLFQRAKKRGIHKWISFFETEGQPTPEEVDRMKEKIFAEKINRKNSKRNK